MAKKTDVPNTPKKPVVNLSNANGNAFVIISKVRVALKRAGLSSQIPAFTKEATSGDYDHVLQTCFKYVEVR